MNMLRRLFYYIYTDHLAVHLAGYPYMECRVSSLQAAEQHGHCLTRV